MYLEQELESLKVVLDIKNKQLHQQEKKLMEVDKLVKTHNRSNDLLLLLNYKYESVLFVQMEKNVKLNETLRKVQQENEDLRARMDRHASLSRYELVLEKG